MQDVLTFAINLIALFGFAYFIVALAAHLHHCWVNPSVEAIAPVTMEPEPTLLLLPAADAELLHPFEMSVVKMAAIEPIVALYLPAAEMEQAEEAIELSPVPAEVEPPAPELIDSAILLEAIDVPAPAESPNLATLTIRQLKQMASERKLPRYSSMKKDELVTALLTL